MPSLKPSQLPAIERLATRKSTILVAPTGAGKTVICLSAIKRVIDAGKVNRVIVAAPAKVVENEVWTKEVVKWEQTAGLSVHTIAGTVPKRLEQLSQALDLKHEYRRATPARFGADVIVISLSNLDWLLNQDHGCDGIIIDELSKAAGKQTKALNTKSKGGCFIWRIGMTATPVSQDYQKLFTMAKRIDGGKALGTAKHNFLNHYFYSDYMGYNWTLKDGADKQIMAKLKKLVHIIDDDKAETLPAVHEHVIRFDMPAETRGVYNTMKKHMVTENREAANAAVQSGVLRQIGSGFTYRQDSEVVDVYDTRRSSEAYTWVKNHPKGTRLIIFYEYKEQGRALEGLFQGRATGTISCFMSPGADILLAQINSLSHGVDGLQRVCSDILFYHPMWSRDAHEQAIGRVWRTGQTEEVNVTTLVCNDTLDELVMSRVEDRGEWMKLFKQHLGAK